MNNSQRLRYRLFDLTDSPTLESDVEEIFDIDQDPEVMHYLTGGVTTTREALYDIFIPRIKSYTDSEKGYGMWRVALPESDECIGELIVRPMHFFSEKPHYHDIELGWRFKKKAWGKGYATEAAKHLMMTLAARPEVTHFTAIADTENGASIAIMKKLGMTFVSHGIHEDPLGDVEVDTYRVAVSELID